MANVWIPPLLQRVTGGMDGMAVPGRTLRQVIHNLDALHPGFEQGVLYDEGRKQPGLSVALDGETHHLRLPDPVQEESEVRFIPSLSGG